MCFFLNVTLCKGFFYCIGCNLSCVNTFTTPKTFTLVVCNHTRGHRQVTEPIPREQEPHGSGSRSRVHHELVRARIY